MPSPVKVRAHRLGRRYRILVIADGVAMTYTGILASKSGALIELRKVTAAVGDREPVFVGRQTFDTSRPSFRRMELIG